MLLCSVRQTVLVASELELASVIVMTVSEAMSSPQQAHAQRCEVYLRVLSVLNGPLSMCQTCGGLHFPLHHPPVFVALNCLPCFRAVCGKLL
jgi:hypothetical protein